MTESFDLRTLRDPIATALEAYEERSDGQVKFNPKAASQLTRTPDKPNFARSKSPATLRDGTVADVYTIAFMPKDGTGDDKTYQLEQAYLGSLPRKVSILPRSKEATLAELSLAFCATDIEEDEGPKLFAGCLSLLGITPKQPVVKLDIVTVGSIGHLGQDHQVLTYNTEQLEPVTTLTVGPVKNNALVMGGERRGDPHAVFNHTQAQLAVVSFFGIARDASTEAFASLQSLNPQVTISEG